MPPTRRYDVWFTLAGVDESTTPRVYERMALYHEHETARTWEDQMAFAYQWCLMTERIYNNFWHLQEVTLPIGAEEWLVFRWKSDQAVLHPTLSTDSYRLYTLHQASRIAALALAQCRRVLEDDHDHGGGEEWLPIKRRALLDDIVIPSLSLVMHISAAETKRVQQMSNTYRDEFNQCLQSRTVVLVAVKLWLQGCELYPAASAMDTWQTALLKGKRASFSNPILSSELGDFWIKLQRSLYVCMMTTWADSQPIRYPRRRAVILYLLDTRLHRPEPRPLPRLDSDSGSDFDSDGSDSGSETDTDSDVRRVDRMRRKCVPMPREVKGEWYTPQLTLDQLGALPFILQLTPTFTSSP